MCAILIRIYVLQHLFSLFCIYIYLSLFLPYGFFFIKKKKKGRVCVLLTAKGTHKLLPSGRVFIYEWNDGSVCWPRAHRRASFSVVYRWDGHPSLPCIYIEYFSQRSFFLLFLFPFSIRLVKCYSHLSRFFWGWPCPPPRANASQQQSFHLKERPSFFKSLILILYFYIDSLCAVHVCSI